MTRGTGQFCSYFNKNCGRKRFRKEICGNGAAFRPCGDEFLFRRGKRNQKIAGENAENVPFSMAFSPVPLFTEAAGGGWGFRWAVKSEKLTATHLLGQKFRTFYGGYMIRPPVPCKDYTRSVCRWVARRHRPSCGSSIEK